MSAFVLTRLDYCSSLLFSLTACSPISRELSSEHSWSHCIPQVKGRLCPGLAAISGSRRIRYRVLHGLFSICLSLAGQLALTSCFLTVPCIRLDKFGHRSFSFPDPSLWNALSLSLSDLNIRGRKKNARHVWSRISLNLCFELLCPLSISRQVSCWPNPRPCLESWNAFKKCSLVFYVSNRQLKPILSLLPLFAFIKSRLCH